MRPCSNCRCGMSFASSKSLPHRAVSWLQHATLLCLLLVSAPLLAHELNLAHFELWPDSTGDGGQLRVQIQNPGPRVDPAALGWPSGCSMDQLGSHHRAGRLQLDMRFQCSERLAVGDELITPWGADGAMIVRTPAEGESETRFVPGRADGVRIPLAKAAGQQQSPAQVLADYTRMGITHILEGWDHLAFVLCLCLLAGGRRLLLLVTAFTLGHSVSLALAHLGYLAIPMPPVEAVIALSVAFMAREVVIQHRSSTALGALSAGQRVWVVAAFGVLHGLGFASELSSLGVQGPERITGLLGFNLGVEIGQLLFVVLALLVMQAARLLVLARPAEHAAMVLVGVMGMYWFIERTAEQLLLWIALGPLSS